MEIRALTITGFRSFGKTQTLEFLSAPGFYSLTGKNSVEPSLGANGAGKSTVWDALTWVLTGKTARGLRASDVAHWSDKLPCSVDLDFAIGDTEYRLSRTWSPNALTLQSDGPPHTIKQEELEQLTRFNHRSFLNTVLMGQFSQFFFDLSPADKLQVFSEALELDLWLTASTQASTKSKQLEQNITATALEIGKVTSRIETLESTVAQLEARSDAYEEERSLELNKLKEHVDQLHAACQAKSDHLQELAAQMSALQTAIDKRQTAIFTTNSAFTNITADQRVLDTQRSSLEQDAQRLVAQYNALGRCEGACPTCLQTVPKNHIERHQQEAQKKHKSVAAELDVVKVKAAELAAKKLQLHQQQQTESAKKQADEQRMVSLSSQYNKEDLELARLDTQERHAENRFQAKTSEVNPYAAQIEASAKELSPLRSSLEELKVKQATLQREQARYQYWVKGFKELRLWLIEEALQQLEIETNNCLQQLGLLGWKIKFDIERSNSSGGVTKGFSVLIIPPNRDEPVSWEAWSGGETQRLRIAGAVGLSSLIKNRRGSRCNIEVWDEPTAHLSGEGVQDLLRFFHNRSQETQTQIWFVDHRTIDYGGFDGEILIEKTKQGSIIHRKYRGHWGSQDSGLHRRLQRTETGRPG